MNKVNEIWSNKLYQDQYDKIQAYEADRIYCGHDSEHFLNVARIGYILVLETGMNVDKEVVYAYGLLHDIGRADQYAGGLDHHLASLNYAEAILKDTSYTVDEVQQIMSAIASHRDEAVKDDLTFEGLMYKADKLSRACYSCKAEATCNWSPEKKNRRIEV